MQCLNIELLKMDTESLEHQMVPFQIAQIRCGEGSVPVSLVIYIDGSFIKHGIPVKPIYGTHTYYK